MTDLTDEQCDEFRRLPGSFNDMVRAIYRAGRESTATPPADAALADDALCESLIEASDMRWNGDVYVGDGADLMNLVRAALRARAVPEAVAKDAERYRWLRSQKSLTLQTEKQPNKWTRHDGSTFSASHYLASGHTVHRVDVSLDATIDAAILSATDSEGRKDE